MAALICSQGSRNLIHCKVHPVYVAVIKSSISIFRNNIGPFRLPERMATSSLADHSNIAYHAGSQVRLRIGPSQTSI